MANVLNPEPESITLNSTLETSTLEPATELEQPSSESTSNPEIAEAVELPELDADAPTEPVAQAETVEAATAEETAPAAAAEAAPEIQAAPEAAAVPSAARAKAPEHGLESMDDFSAALAAFEREQAAEAAAVEAYGDKIVSGTVLKQTEKHLVVDVGLKSEGLVPLEQVLDHSGAVRFNPGDVIDVVIEREEPEGGYLVSYERAQRLRVWDVIERPPTTRRR
jgi:small subunit ribosomal protein S1